MTHPKLQEEVKEIKELTPIQYHILCTTDRYGEYCYSYKHFEKDGFVRKDLEVAMKQLRNAGLMEFSRGLMDEDGMVAGSGHGIKYGKGEEVEKLILKYENDNIKIYSERDVQKLLSLEHKRTVEGVRDFLLKEGYLKSKNILPTKKPTHGSCCTCQTCGELHEDCICESNKINKFLASLTKNG